MNISKMAKWTDDFTASVALLDHAYALKDNWISNRWSFIAARNGGLALRNFSEHLAAARGLVGKIPAWLPVLDVTALKEVATDFAERFPRIEKLRHAVAHPEFYANPSKDMKGGGSTADGKIAIAETISVQDALIHRTYATSINGISVSYDLTVENSAFLLGSLNKSYLAVQRVFRQQDGGDSQ